MKSENTSKNILNSDLKTHLKLNEIHRYENTVNVFQKAFVSLQCNCALCNTHLEITVLKQDNDEIKEEAFCPQCELRLRSKNYKIQ